MIENGLYFSPLDRGHVESEFAVCKECLSFREFVRGAAGLDVISDKKLIEFLLMFHCMKIMGVTIPDPKCWVTTNLFKRKNTSSGSGRILPRCFNGPER